MSILFTPLSALLDEAAEVLAFFLTESTSTSALPDGWVDDYNGGVEKSTLMGEDEFRVSIGYDDDLETCSVDSYESNGPCSRRVYFTFSRFCPYFCEEGEETNGITICIDEHGRVESVEDWNPGARDDSCFDILGATRFSHLLMEGNRLIPLPPNFARC
jgi:hypothetical protein